MLPEQISLIQNVKCISYLSTGQQYLTDATYFITGHKICERCTTIIHHVELNFIHRLNVQFGWPKLCIVWHVSEAVLLSCTVMHKLVLVFAFFTEGMGFTVFARISNLLRTNCFNNIHFQFMMSTTSVG